MFSFFKPNNHLARNVVTAGPESSLLASEG